MDLLLVTLFNLHSLNSIGNAWISFEMIVVSHSRIDGADPYRAEPGATCTILLTLANHFLMDLQSQFHILIILD